MKRIHCHVLTLHRATAVSMVAVLALCVLFLLSHPASADDAFEPNNSHDAARELPLFTVFKLDLPDKDQDWFRIDATSAGMLMVHYLGDSGKPLPRSSLHANDGKQTRINYSANEPGLDVARLDKGSYLINFTRGSAPAATYEFRVNFIEHASGLTEYQTGNLFMLAMELNASQVERLKKIADMGGGSVITVSANDANLALGFARIVEESRGSGFSIADYTATLMDRVYASLHKDNKPAYSRAILTKQVAALKSLLQDKENRGREEFQAARLAMFMTARRDAVMKHDNKREMQSDYLAESIKRALQTSLQPK
jgi:hypothetical protein